MLVDIVRGLLAVSELSETWSDAFRRWSGRVCLDALSRTDGRGSFGRS